MRGWSWRAWGRGVPALVLALLVSACGFRPMMAAHDGGDPGVADHLARVQIAPIEDRTGQVLRNRLIDQFYRDGRPAAPEYRLDVTLETTGSIQSIEKNAVASRALWTVIARYRLVHLASGRVVTSGFAQNTPGYNLSYAQYASLVSEQSALDRGIEAVGDDVTRRISLFFARDPDQRPAVTRP